MYQPPRFHQFVAVDWSGAKQGYRRKLQVAACTVDGGAPYLVRSPPGGWTRRAIADYVIALGAATPPTLVGFDFSFAPPFEAGRGYWPGLAAHDAKALWQAVATCEDADLGAASFIETRFPSEFYHGARSGPKAPFLKWRACERAFNLAGGGKAASIFDTVGAAQVAKGSFAGMRLLHRVAPHVSIWPMHLQPSPTVVVEIYCRAFLRHAGGRGTKLRTLRELNDALAALGSPGLRSLAALTDDKTDALVAAAGLRWLGNRVAAWQPKGLTPAIAATEGWTFGVMPD